MVHGTLIHLPHFNIWCSEEIYFQNNKLEAIEASKVTIVSRPCTIGHEPIQDFYITASNTIDFSDEIELYRGKHTLSQVVSSLCVSEHEFAPKGSYQFYRLYVVSWWPFNQANGQNVIGCYIE